MHYMMLSHDHTKSPGRYRKGPIYVRDERRDMVIYEGPDAADVPALMDTLVQSLRTGVNSDPVVRSAMAHLNLVMIHPFRDGNGRMARALATLAQTVARRIDEAGETWTDLDRLVTEHDLPERTMEAMFDAVLGYRVRRAGDLKRAAVTEQTATRDLAAMASAGILTPHGNGRGRYYAGGHLKQIQERRRARRKPLRDPYPWIRAKLNEPSSLGE